MIFDVQISEQADRDLRGIYEYIAFELLAPENAAGQLDRLENAISKLDHMPDKFRRYDREPWKSRGLRETLIKAFPAPNARGEATSYARLCASCRRHLRKN